jgi:hypothetical protein
MFKKLIEKLVKALECFLAEDDFRSVSNRSCDGGFSEEVIGELEIVYL